MTKLNKTFIIVNKETQKQWIASSGKSSWKQINHAKSAFAASSSNREDESLSEFYVGKNYWDTLKFKDQTVYEVVELKSEYTLKLEKIKTLLESYDFNSASFNREVIEEFDLLSSIRSIIGE